MKRTSGTLTKALLAFFLAGVAGTVSRAAPSPPGAGEAPAGENDEGRITVSFEVRFFPVQKALWIEDNKGNYLRTLHVSRWQRFFGEEYNVLPDWVAASSRAREEKSFAQMDAVTSATLRAGEERVSFSWDLTDWKGERAGEGVCRVILQCDGGEGVVVTWKGEIETGKGPASIKLAPDPPELHENLEMYLADVTVTYHPNSGDPILNSPNELK